MFSTPTETLKDLEQRKHTHGMFKVVAVLCALPLTQINISNLLTKLSPCVHSDDRKSYITEIGIVGTP